MHSIIAPSRIGDYVFKKTIGEGAFSVVKLATNIKTNKYFACKVVPHISISSDELRERFESEIRINQQLHHQGIVQIVDLLKDQMNSYIFMEFCPNGELFKYIVEKGNVEEDEAKTIIYQVLKALQYVHSLGIAHRDLKPENLLFDKFGQIKISDFGLSRFVNKNQLVETPCGSPCYASPECISGNPYDAKKSDIWSLGVILYATVNGHLPWTKKNQFQLFEQISKGDYIIPTRLSPDLQDLLKSMMTVDPNKRISAAEALKHKWFADVQNVSIKEKEDLTIVSLKKVDKFFTEPLCDDIFLSGRKDNDDVEPLMSQRAPDFNFVAKEIKCKRGFKAYHSTTAGRKSSFDSSTYAYTKSSPHEKSQMEKFSSSLRPQKNVPKIVKPKIMRYSTFT